MGCADARGRGGLTSSQAEGVASGIGRDDFTGERHESHRDRAVDADLAVLDVDPDESVWGRDASSDVGEGARPWCDLDRCIAGFGWGATGPAAACYWWRSSTPAVGQINPDPEPIPGCWWRFSGPSMQRLFKIGSWHRVQLRG